MKTPIICLNMPIGLKVPCLPDNETKTEYSFSFPVSALVVLIIMAIYTVKKKGKIYTIG